MGIVPGATGGSAGSAAGALLCQEGRGAFGEAGIRAAPGCGGGGVAAGAAAALLCPRCLSSQILAGEGRRGYEGIRDARVMRDQPFLPSNGREMERL